MKITSADNMPITYNVTCNFEWSCYQKIDVPFLYVRILYCFVRLGWALLLYIAACPGAGVRKIEKFFWGLISLLRLAETMLGRPQSCWGKKETEHKWSCTTPMSWPKKVIKKAFGHHRGCIVKHFPPYLMWKKILDALFFPARLSVVEKLVQNTVSLNFPAFFRLKQEILSFQ